MLSQHKAYTSLFKLIIISGNSTFSARYVAASKFKLIAISILLISPTSHDAYAQISADDPRLPTIIIPTEKAELICKRNGFYRSWKNLVQRDPISEASSSWRQGDRRLIVFSEIGQPSQNKALGTNCVNVGDAKEQIGGIGDHLLPCYGNWLAAARKYITEYNTTIVSLSQEMGSFKCPAQISESEENSFIPYSTRRK